MLRIEYSLAVLEEIRRTIQEGFHKIPHGGVETGGLLYGKHEAGVLTISAWRPLQCEHPLGPRFQLSAADEEALAAQLAEPPAELAELEAVGWFASHSRGALQLRGPDLDLHSKFFPEPWQPILLLCAARNQPMQAAFYTRAEGTLAVGVEVAGFEVIPNPTAVPRRQRRPQPEQATPAAEPAQHAERPRRRLASRLGALPSTAPGYEAAAQPAAAPPISEGPELVEHGSGSWSPIDPSTIDHPWLARGYERVEETGRETITGAAPAAPFPEPAPEEELPKFSGAIAAETSIPWKRIGWAAMWLLIAAGGVSAIPRFASTASAAAIDLSVKEVPDVAPGQLAIRWNLKAADRLNLRGGELIVADAGDTRRFPLSPAELQSGALTYWRRSGEVQVNLTMTRANGQTLSGVASFAGAPAPPPPALDRDPEVRALREALGKARQSGRRLERLVAAQERKARR